eukprot:8374147-Alexandrium_andersonii.AAC.1
MSASLVGSEMCIRDRLKASKRCVRPLEAASGAAVPLSWPVGVGAAARPCLLYTSDAADDM